MNIFTLSPPAEIPGLPCPSLSARMHCDQHLHKMILESAQMLSTAMHHLGIQSDWLYKPSYPKHPCTIWVSSSPSNALWLCELALELETIRQELDHPFHSSTDVIKFCSDTLQELFPGTGWIYASDFPFAGPAFLALNKSMPVWEKYQAFYLRKAKDWLDKGRPMSYKDRPLPEFLQPYAKDLQILS